MKRIKTYISRLLPLVTAVVPIVASAKSDVVNATLMLEFERGICALSVDSAVPGETVTMIAIWE